jgi:hypothetical protein
MVWTSKLFVAAHYSFCARGGSIRQMFFALHTGFASLLFRLSYRLGRIAPYTFQIITPAPL